MERNTNLPDRLIELFNEKTSSNIHVDAETPLHGGDSIKLSSTSKQYPVEFTIPLGQAIVAETGYAIAGMRKHDKGVVLWFDQIESDDRDAHLTVAQRAARCLDEGTSNARFEPNISKEEDEQYVAVYPEPHEHATEDFSLKEDDMNRLREDNLAIRKMSCGIERSSFDEGNYRIWFQSIESCE